MHLALAIFLAVNLTGDGSPLEKVASLPPVRIVYEQQVADGSGKVISTSTGTLDLQYPCFAVESGRVRICGDGATMWYRDAESDEITISNGNIINTILSDSSLSSQGEAQEITFNAADGHKMVFKMLLVENMAEKWPESHFVQNESEIGENTIVTDLR